MTRFLDVTPPKPPRDPFEFTVTIMFGLVVAVFVLAVTAALVALR